MSRRILICILFVLAITAVGLRPTHADIYRWDTGEAIPGTEGIEPGPGVDLSKWKQRRPSLARCGFLRQTESHRRQHRI